MNTLHVLSTLFALSLAASAQQHAPEGGRRVLVPGSGPSTHGGSESVSVPPDVQGAERLPFVALAVRDQAQAGQSIMASTEPTLGMLYPLSSHLFVAPYGTVGVGTATPSSQVLLHVEGKALFGNGNASAGPFATVSGGLDNAASGPLGTVGGGQQNAATGHGSTVGGGSDNDVSGYHSVVSGGQGNGVAGHNAVVPGGFHNEAAGNFSFAAGREAHAAHAGSFVWSDSNGDGIFDTPFVSTAMDQFLVEAAGGVGIGTNTPLARLHVEGATGEDVLRVRIAGQTRLMLAANGALSVGANVGQPAFDLQLSASGTFGGTAGKPGGGSWSVSSDRRLKQNVAELAGSLERLLALRGVTYEYIDPARTNELPGTHTGMIAQEVQGVFPDWVAEAPDGFLRLTFRGFEALTVEALRELRAEKDAELGALREELAELRRLVAGASVMAGTH